MQKEALTLGPSVVLGGHELSGRQKCAPQPGASSTRSRSQDVERRRAPRVDLPFPAIVRGIDATGERFTLNVQLDNLSACRLYFRVRQPVGPGTKLLLIGRLSPTLDTGPSVALRGTVLRAEAQADGCYRLAVEFKHHRFVFAPGARLEGKA